MKLQRILVLCLPVLITACSTMSNSGPAQNLQVVNRSTNAAQCAVYDQYSQQLAVATIPKGQTGAIVLHTSPAENALVCKCADCKSKDSYSAFAQLSSGKPCTLVGDPNKQDGGKAPYILY